MLNYIHIINSNEKLRQIEINNNTVVDIQSGESLFINEKQNYFELKIIDGKDLLLTFENDKTILLKNFVELLSIDDFNGGEIIDFLQVELHFSNGKIASFSELLDHLQESSSQTFSDNFLLYEEIEETIDLSEIIDRFKNKDENIISEDVRDDESSNVNTHLKTVDVPTPIVDPLPAPIEDFPWIPDDPKLSPPSISPIEDFPWIPSETETDINFDELFVIGEEYELNFDNFISKYLDENSSKQIENLKNKSAEERSDDYTFGNTKINFEHLLTQEDEVFI